MRRNHSYVFAKHSYVFFSHRIFDRLYGKMFAEYGGECMVYYTGDIHGAPYKVVRFSKAMNLTKNDIIVILGDVGVNY